MVEDLQMAELILGILFVLGAFVWPTFMIIHFRRIDRCGKRLKRAAQRRSDSSKKDNDDWSPPLL
jgi:hypothetical protein